MAPPCSHSSPPPAFSPLPARLTLGAVVAPVARRLRRRPAPAGGASASATPPRRRRRPATSAMPPATISPAAPRWRPATCEQPPTISRTRWPPRRAISICAARCSSCCSRAASSTAPWRRRASWTRAAPLPTRRCCCWPWTLPGAARIRRRWRCSSAWAPPTSPGRCSRCCWPGRVSPPARAAEAIEALAAPDPNAGLHRLRAFHRAAMLGLDGRPREGLDALARAFPDLAEAPARVLRGGLALQLAAGDRAAAERSLAKVARGGARRSGARAAGGGGGQRRRRAGRGPGSRHRHGRRADQHRRGLLRAGPQRRGADARPGGDLRDARRRRDLAARRPRRAGPGESRPRRCARWTTCPRTARSPGPPGLCGRARSRIWSATTRRSRCSRPWRSEAPTRPDALVAMGDLLRGEDRFAEAEAAYTRAIAAAAGDRPAAIGACSMRAASPTSAPSAGRRPRPICSRRWSSSRTSPSCSTIWATAGSTRG